MNDLQRFKPEADSVPLPLGRSSRHHEPELYRDQEAWFVALRAIEQSQARVLKSLSLTPQLCGSLLEIACHGDGLTVGALAVCMGVRHNTMVYVLNRLTALKLAERVRSEQDRRQVCLRLTPRGQEVIRRYVAAELKAMGAVQAALEQALGLAAELAA